MNKLCALALALAVSSSAACAQTPATNPMPDGSRDMYAGLGLASAPRYDGAASNKTGALPVLQVQWSNGAFISGMGAGIHWSDNPAIEYGPLAALHPGRSPSGTGASIGGAQDSLASQVSARASLANPNRLHGMDEIKPRLEAGGFLNYYLAPAWRLTGSILAGAGNDSDGMRAQLGIQRLALQVAPHHTVALSAGASLVNSAYNRAYFGVGAQESFASGHPDYRPRGGLKDVYLGARWNWALSPAWIVTSTVQATQLLGDARRSPLVGQPVGATLTAALAYRF
ncbi:MipA/OmpV family protein [Massilia sp. H6]|uniref:MipA/OmpV family protein n=1 Tax=Massilia sp. H6 TaxID=2970464 RepID=UPI0021698965|nr:MipA/OmpV family protein [Massilia sp. H6]UVW29895.1 MipA/OmpV family protein [Massilia sp. H6]